MSISDDDFFEFAETPVISSLSPTPVGTDGSSSDNGDYAGAGLSNSSDAASVSGSCKPATQHGVSRFSLCFDIVF